ncbi:hypothetical protein N0V83_002829 [Neocucurbitaria cava]|uniref:Uncharacterized protein n=1 Tax=Neocucurbitaria cava TaxID=798079 RepID=A0A9W8YCA0_9PLEO|nr:hypothetical protein N0V83_002829 [Neocucurbitaria cava]
MPPTPMANTDYSDWTDDALRAAVSRRSKKDLTDKELEKHTQLANRQQWIALLEDLDRKADEVEAARKAQITGTTEAAQDAGWQAFRFFLLTNGLREEDEEDVEEGLGILRGLGYGV